MVALSLCACTDEVPEPIDLDGTTSTTEIDLADPNAGERERMQELARQQCLDDPDRVEGVVRLVDPETDQAVAEVVVRCDEVRGP